MINIKSPGRTKQKGFTLIELMITVAILGILASIAIGSYRDFNIRAKVSEGLVSLSPLTTAIGTYYWGESRLPTSRAEAGASNIVTKYIDEVTITANGYISVDFNDSAVGVTNMYLILMPIIVTGAIRWECLVSNTATGITPASEFKRYVPPGCR